MARKLSEQLAGLSVRAKSTEDAVAAAQREGRDKLVARKEQAHRAAAAAVEKVNQEITSVDDNLTKAWAAARARIAADMNA